MVRGAKAIYISNDVYNRGFKLVVLLVSIVCLLYFYCWCCYCYCCCCQLCMQHLIFILYMNWFRASTKFTNTGHCTHCNGFRHKVLIYWMSLAQVVQNGFSSTVIAANNGPYSIHNTNSKCNATKTVKSKEQNLTRTRLSRWEIQIKWTFFFMFVCSFRWI